MKKKKILMSLLKCCAYRQLFIIHSIEQKEALGKARGNCALKVIDENLYVLQQLLLFVDTAALFLLYFTQVPYPKKILKAKKKAKDYFT